MCVCMRVCMRVGGLGLGLKGAPTLSTLRQISWDAGTACGAGVQTLVSDPVWPADKPGDAEPSQAWG